MKEKIKKFLDFIRNHFKALLFLVFVIWLFSPSEEEVRDYNLAKVYIKGEIFIADDIIDELREIYENDEIRGVLLIIDSVGGAVDKSIEISDIVKKIAKKKVVVTYASGTLASGSYYSAIWSNEIIANRGSLIGSIGVIFSGFNYQQLAEKIGISPQVVKMGKYKEVGTGSREWLPYEEEEIEKVIKDMYKTFVTDVAKARGLDLNRSNEFADAHIFTARQALEVGLIDATGTIIDAEKRVEELSGVTNPVWEKDNELDRFFKSIATSFLGEITAYLGWKVR